MTLFSETVSLANLFVFSERVFGSLLFGALIGIERQRYSHPAGLRTNTLVAAGSALFVAMPYLTGGDTSPSRVAAQVVSGIGFLGAGVILREGLNVRGLNTAATLWCSSAIGVLAGGGLLIEAAIGTSAIILVNIAFRPLAGLIRQPGTVLDQEIGYTLKVACLRRKESRIRSLFLHFLTKDANLILQGITSSQAEAPDKTNVTATMVSLSKNDRLMEDLVARVGLEEGVASASWELTALR
ncbi:MAG TPA: MgtC/SapB family protein [Candidatus Methylacidiphilales bacterium]|nr:MgtC/SapB family protein [Candidatus Methylacidiphilales bacterium]